MARGGDGGRWRRPARLAGVGAVGLLVAWAVLVRTAVGQRLDGEALDNRFVAGATATHRLEQLLDAVSARSMILGSVVLVLVALARGRLVRAAGVAVALGGSMATTQVLKERILVRPDLGNFGGVSYNTFPSGHATAGIALALGLVLVTPARVARVAAVAATIAGPTLGLAVLTTGGHRPSDSIGAFLVGLMWFGAAAAVVASLERADRIGPVARGRLVVSGLTVAVALAGVVVWSLTGPARRDGQDLGAYLLGCLGIVATGAAVVAAFAVAVHGGRPVAAVAPGTVDAAGAGAAGVDPVGGRLAGH